MSSSVIDKTAQAFKQASLISAEKFKDFAENMHELAVSAPPMGAPVLTGTLRNSIALVGNDGRSTKVIKQTKGDATPASSGDAGPMKIGDFALFSSCDYGAHVHMGTRRMAANPFFNRAYDRSKVEFEDSGPWVR